MTAAMTGCAVLSGTGSGRRIETRLEDWAAGEGAVTFQFERHLNGGADVVLRVALEVLCREFWVWLR